MATGIEHLLHPSTGCAGPARLNVVVAYDESPAGRRGMEMCRRLQRGAPPEMVFWCDLWRFDLLSFPSVREAAVLAGMHAQLIVVSANADRGLPSGVKQWLEQSLEGKLPGSAALAALLHSERGTPLKESLVRDMLEAIARRRSIDFLGHSSMDPVASAHMAPPIEASSFQASRSGEDRLQRRPRPARWGINE